VGGAGRIATPDGLSRHPGSAYHGSAARHVITDTVNPVSPVPTLGLGFEVTLSPLQIKESRIVGLT